MTLTQVLVTALAVLVAGVAKGAIGMGLPPIALAIMSFAVPLESAIGAQRIVPPDSEIVGQARRVGVCFGDRLPPRAARRMQSSPVCTPARMQARRRTRA